MRQAGFTFFGLILLVTVVLLSQSVDKVQVHCGARSGPCPSTTAENGVVAFNIGSPEIAVDNKNTVAFSIDITSGFEQLIAFRRQRAPAYQKGVAWVSGSETEPLTYPDPLEIPVRFWILCADSNPDDSCKSPGTSFMEELEDFPGHANYALWKERVGIRLTTTAGWIDDGSADPRFQDMKEFDAPGECAALRSIVTDPSATRFDPSAVNIYFVSRVFTGEVYSAEYGFRCEGENFAVVGNNVIWKTILHEIGHMFALVDLEGSTFGGRPAEENYMHNASGNERKYYTEGQIFRIHFDLESFVPKLFPFRREHQRFCGTDDVDAQSADPPCPKVTMRVWPD